LCCWIVSIFEHRVLLGRLALAIGHVPEDERARVHPGTGAVDGAPPTTDHDLPTRKHDALVSPKGFHVDAAVRLQEVLHHGDALPARDAILRRQRVEPALHVEVLRVVVTVAAEAIGGGREINLIAVRTAGGALLGARTRLVLRRLEGVEDTFELAVPSVAIVVGGELELDGLKRSVRVLLTIQLVLDLRVVALA